MEGWGGPAIRMAACSQHLPHGVPSPGVWGVPALSGVGDRQVMCRFPQPLCSLEQSLVKCQVGLDKCCVPGQNEAEMEDRQVSHTSVKEEVLKGLS